MKINRLDAHDRLEHFQQDQSENMAQGVDDCLKVNKDSVSMQRYFPYIYIFGHPRTHDYEPGIQRMIWQPRLLKPQPQTNSYLFRALSNTDLLEIIWMLPPRELWGQHDKGKITANEYVQISIDNFVNHREALARPHEDDFSEEKIRKMLEDIEDGFKSRLVL